jgi:hypothetical protein
VPGGRQVGDAAIENEELELLEVDEIEGFELRALAPEVTVEYFGRLEDDRYVVVTRPEHDWSYEDFRAFIGPSDRVLERRVSSVARQRDGGTTTIVIEIEGERAELYFPVQREAERFVPGPATLSQDGNTLAIERQPPEREALEKLAFVCR